mmetsp:Transcript_98268/g.194679  ORF Transcript_98268/g.194679 Transcript_98268/m.194679 type:complete len:324 (-) Transcript_98268:86-1057(-)
MGLLPRWLFNIPVQVGPVTEYARKLRPWMHTILIIQVIMSCCKLFVLKEITGPLWMLLVSGVGWYALYMDLNITYVCLWGALCVIQGFLEFLCLVIPGATGILKWSFLNTVVRVSAPLVYLLGALFAWHLFHDYETSRGHKTSSFDPMAKAVDVFGCDEKTPLGAASGFFGGMVNRAKGMRAPKGTQNGGIQDGFAGMPANSAGAAAHGGAQQAQYGAAQMNSAWAVPGAVPQSAASATWGPQGQDPRQQAGGQPGMMQHPFSTHGGFGGGPDQTFKVPQHAHAPPPGYGQAPGSAQSLLSQAFGGGADVHIQVNAHGPRNPS